jgi:hypothetical protein
MRFSPRKAVAVGIVSAVLVAGGGAAIAASSTGTNADVKAAAQELEAQADRRSDLASRLGVTVAELEAAYAKAAAARIDDAEAAGDITAAEATALRDALAGDDHLAKHLARPADVAELLGVTEEELESAMTAARKAEAKARVDQAVADGMITEEYAAQLKQQIDEADFAAGPGFDGPGFGGPHGPGGFGPGPGDLGGLGFGFGVAPPEAPTADTGSGSAA